MEPVMSSFAVLRVAKLKSLGSLGAASQHQLRSRPTPNANPGGQVRLLAGSSDPATAAQALLASLPKAPKAGSVLAVEAVMSASPAFFRPSDPAAAGTYDEAKTVAWAETSVHWLKRHFGEHNVASAVLHLDESTPHIHAVIVPLDCTPRKKGKTPRLNAKRWLGGRERLSAMQDDYADFLAGLGITRGVKGSRAKHMDIKRYYSEAAKREDALKGAQNAYAQREEAFRLGMRLFMQKRLVPAADGVLIYRSQADRRTFEPKISPFRFAVWATIRRIQQIIEQDVMREIAAIVAPEPEQSRSPPLRVR
jgi:hypothetical protein